MRIASAFVSTAALTKSAAGVSAPSDTTLYPAFSSAMVRMRLPTMCVSEPMTPVTTVRINLTLLPAPQLRCFAGHQEHRLGGCRRYIQSSCDAQQELAARAAAFDVAVCLGRLGERKLTIDCYGELSCRIGREKIFGSRVQLLGRRDVVREMR